MSSSDVSETTGNTFQENLLVFTDLDGTLLDHDNYSFAAAKPALSKLESLSVPVIPTTSKTFAELRELRTALGNEQPFIVENGAAVFIPKNTFKSQPEGTISQDMYWVKAFALPRSEWAVLISEMPENLRTCFKTFAELGEEGIAQATDLSLEQSALANQRDFSEPLYWTEDKERIQALKDWLAERSIKLEIGGRFLHMNTGYNKGVAMNWLSECYQREQTERQVLKIALGDSGNDTSMLLQADYPIVIKKYDGTHLSLGEDDGAIKSRLIGPEGWNQEILALLEKLG